MERRIGLFQDLGIDPCDSGGSQPTDWQAGVAQRGQPQRGGERAIVIGAGLTGLTVAWQLAAAGIDVTVLEATSHVGGMATTVKHGDFLLDLGPHKFFSTMQDRMQVAEQIMAPDGFMTVPKRSRILLAGHMLNYPVGLMDVMTNLSPTITVPCGLSYLAQLVRNVFDRRPARSYEDWLVRRFGRRLYQLVFAPYARKIWGDPQALTRELAETRVAIPGLLPLLWRMLVAPRAGAVIHAEAFRYPALGSGYFCSRLAGLVLQHGGGIRLQTPVVGLTVENSHVIAVETALPETIEVRSSDAVISTMPLTYLVQVIEPAVPDSVAQAACRLKSRDLILLYLILNRPRVSDDHWLFVPEGKYLFTRISEQKNFSPQTCPADRTCLCLEIVASDAALWHASDADLYQRAVADLEEMGLAYRTQVVEFFTKRMKWVYPVYDLEYTRSSGVVLGYLDGITNLYSVGRRGGFNYVGQIDCLDIGMVTAEHVLRRAGKALWPDARQRFASYKVLD